MNCDHCKFYSWYFDRCGKWDCKVDPREVHNCFESNEIHVVRDIMVSGSQQEQMLHTTYTAMKEAEEYDEEGEMSGRRGRAMNGRFVSRDYGPQSYDDGYSGHYPYPPAMGYGYRGRNW